MLLTKNIQTNDNLRRMTAAAFPGLEMVSAIELTEGLCNAAYRITLSDGRDTILKIAPERSENLLANEVGLMTAEVAAMELVRQHTDLPIAAVQFYDTSKTLCTSDYFFMDALPGRSLFSIRDSLPKDVYRAYHREIGRCTQKIASITGPHFGLLGDPDHQFTRLHDLLRWMVHNVLNDAARKAVVIGVSAEDILAALDADGAIFDEVTTPRLIHWDMWEGNIFVQDGHVSGIIDWERAMWSEPLMDDRFRRHTRTDAFLAGYGKPELTPSETRRILWYDLFLYLTMMTEGEYRGYPDDSQYRWTKPLFEATWAALRA